MSGCISNDARRPGRRSPGGPADYYALFPITVPAYRVTRLAGQAIERAAATYFRGRLLEIGCGTKAKAALVGSFVEEHVGLDHEQSPHDTSAVDIFGSADSIPAPDKSFDCVLSTSVLEHLEEPAAALREMFRILKPGGHAIYTAPLFWHLHEEPRDFFRYTSHGLRHLFESAGLSIIELEPLSGFVTMMTAESGYFLRRFRRGLLGPIVDAAVVLLNWISLLDRGMLRDESFTWAYLIVARRPE